MAFSNHTDLRSIISRLNKLPNAAILPLTELDQRIAQSFFLDEPASGTGA